MADPLLGAVASTVVGSGLNALSADAQRRHDYARLQESREYNSPKNQVKRLREAGINPALALTNGMISSGTMDQTAGGQSAPVFDFSPIAQGVRSSVELSQQKALQDSQIRNQDSNTIAQNQRNLFGLQNAYIDTLRNIQELKKSGADTKFLEKRADLMQKEIDAFDQRNSEEVARIRAERIKLDEESQTERVMRDVNRRCVEQQIRLSKTQQSLLSEQAKQVVESVNQMILNGASQRQINSFIADKERETSRLLFKQNSTYQEEFNSKMRLQSAETGKANREHSRNTFSFFGIPLGTKESIIDYSSDKGNFNFGYMY